MILSSSNDKPSEKSIVKGKQSDVWMNPLGSGNGVYFLLKSNFYFQPSYPNQFFFYYF